MTSIRLKVIGLTRPGFENVRYGFEHATFGFTDLPEREAGALTHSATLTGHSYLDTDALSKNVFDLERILFL